MCMKLSLQKQLELSEDDNKLELESEIIELNSELNEEQED